MVYSVKRAFTPSHSTISFRLPAVLFNFSSLEQTIFTPVFWIQVLTSWNQNLACLIKFSISEYRLGILDAWISRGKLLNKIEIWFIPSCRNRLAKYAESALRPQKLNSSEGEKYVTKNKKNKEGRAKNHAFFEVISKIGQIKVFGQ